MRSIGMTQCEHGRWQVTMALSATALLCWPHHEACADVRVQASVRLRGPLHEAFAAPLAGADQPGKIIERRPAKPLGELPAAVKPSSRRAVWVPGYWGWEPAELDFVWIPGVWRIPPPGMRWVPGYWSDREGSFRWMRGFWYPVKETRLSYLPSPPERRRQPSPAHSMGPSEFRVPGYWSHEQGEYRWKPDFAAPHKPGWIWIGAHWVWTPRGALFVPGYWDYALANRGIAFAPIQFDANGETARGRVTRPTVAVNVAELPEAMFIAAGLGHYCFGDYFSGDLGDELRPWYELEASGDLDPNFAYQRWQRRDQQDWQQRLAERYRARRENAESRPAVEFNADRHLNSSMRSLGVSIRVLDRARDARWSIMQLPSESVRQAAVNAASVESLAAQRASFEAEAGGTKEPLAFDLPPPVAPLDRVRPASQPASATAGQYIPGVIGREVPGAAKRRLPGTTGRTLPGVDVRVPGAASPGTLPGADTGLERK